MYPLIQSCVYQKKQPPLALGLQKTVQITRLRFAGLSNMPMGNFFVPIRYGLT